MVAESRVIRRLTEPAKIPGVGGIITGPAGSPMSLDGRIAKDLISERETAGRFTTISASLMPPVDVKSKVMMPARIEPLSEVISTTTPARLREIVRGMQEPAIGGLRRGERQQIVHRSV